MFIMFFKGFVVNLVSKSKPKILGRLKKFVDYILFCEAADQDLNLKILVDFIFNRRTRAQ